MGEAFLDLTAILSLIAIVLLIMRPYWGVLALFVVRPLIDATWGQSVVGDFKLTEIVSSLVPIIVICRMVFADDRDRFANMPLKWIWVAWSIDVALFSCFIMTDDWRAGLSVMMRHLNGLTGFYMVQAYCRNDSDFRRLAWAIAIAGLFPMGTGVLEAITGVHWRITLGEDDVVRNIGLYHDAITIRYLALQTIMGLLLIAALSKPSIMIGIGSLIYGLAGALVLKGAYSKSGFLTLGLWILLWPLLRKNFVLFGGVLLAIAIVALSFSHQFMDSMGFVFGKEISAFQGTGQVDQTFAGRWYLWKSLAEEWQTLSITGQLFGAGRIATGSHNDYLQVLFHGGVLGLAIYVTLLLAVGWSIARSLWARRDIWSIAPLFAFIMWMVDTIGLIPSAYSGYQWFVWGIIGFCLRRQREGERDSELSDASVTVERFPNLLRI